MVLLLEESPPPLCTLLIRTEKPLPHTVACQQTVPEQCQCDVTSVTECYPPIRISPRRRNMKVAALAALGVLIAFHAEAAPQQRQLVSPATTCDNDGHCKTASADATPAVHQDSSESSKDDSRRCAALAAAATLAGRLAIAARPAVRTAIAGNAAGSSGVGATSGSAASAAGTAEARADCN